MKNLFKGGNTAHKRWKYAIPAVTASVIVAGALMLTSGKDARDGNTDALLLAKEELLGEKLQLEKLLVELERKHAELQERCLESDARIAALGSELAAARRSTRPTSGVTASDNPRVKRELADARSAQERLRNELDAARDGQRGLQDQLNALRADRDALAARLGQQQKGARMVNNAVVDAVRGKRQQLTVRARRASEIRMAFDLPENIAEHATFKLTSPSGKVFEGGSPTLSVAPGNQHDEALAARFPLVGGDGQERASRVHLKFKPERRMEAGTYRIDIRSGELYLNTVMLNLR